MEKSCRFCSIKGNTDNKKVNNLSAQLIEYQYIDEFYFYFSKSINEIINNIKTPDTIWFKDLLRNNPLQSYIFNYHSKTQIATKLTKQLDNKAKRNVYPTTNAFSNWKILNERKVKHQRILNQENSDYYPDHKKRSYIQRAGNILNKLDDESIKLTSFELKVHDIYYPSFSSNKKSKKETTLGSLLVKTIDIACYHPDKNANRNKSNIFLVNDKIINSNFFDSTPEILCKNQSDTFIVKSYYGNMDDSNDYQMQYYGKNPSNTCVPYPDNNKKDSYFVDPCNNDYDDNDCYIAFSGSISNILQHNSNNNQIDDSSFTNNNPKNKTRQNVNIISQANFEKSKNRFTKQIDRNEETGTGRLCEKFIANFKKNIKSDIERRISLKFKQQKSKAVNNNNNNNINDKDTNQKQKTDDLMKLELTSTPPTKNN